MKAFLLKLAAFGLILLAFNTAVLIVVETHYHRPYKKEVPGEIHTLVVADSHGESSLGNELENSGFFNFSIGSDSYHDMLRKLRHTIRAAPDLRRVILTADNHTLSAYREHANNTDRSIRYLKAGEPDPFVANRYQDALARHARRWLPLFNPKARSLVKAWLDGLLRKTSTPTPSGKGQGQNLEHLAEARVSEQFPGMTVSEDLRESLEAIVETARRNGLEVIGIKFPLSEPYLRHLGGRNYGADSVLRELGVEVLDYQNLYPDEDSLFKDSDHLNRRGRSLFSETFIGDIQRRDSLKAR